MSAPEFLLLSIIAFWADIFICQNTDEYYLTRKLETYQCPIYVNICVISHNIMALSNIKIWSNLFSAILTDLRTTLRREWFTSQCCTSLSLLAMDCIKYSKCLEFKIKQMWQILRISYILTMNSEPKTITRLFITALCVSRSNVCFVGNGFHRQNKLMQNKWDLSKSREDGLLMAGKHRRNTL